ncbi:MAG: alcohol dehydrogenase catalytic domain-containing protein [Desulfobacterales bacterium]|jgi:NADPH:quinone reductase-like Zn-dependent oxidoreductase
MLPHKFPIILGWDLAGVIEETGYSVRRFTVGGKIFSYTRRPIVQQRTYAEYAALPES